MPKQGLGQRPQTYAQLRDDLDEFGNALGELEADIPFDLVPLPTRPATTAGSAALSSLGNALYFCVPRNDKLLGYWDTVADRLFKIRNSLNIQGVFRQLPLFEPPIDPALLARAAAAGLDVGAVVSGLNQPLPLVRFQLLVQKAAEICQEVKSLGSSLLAAIEKEDNEALAILRAQHERVDPRAGGDGQVRAVAGGDQEPRRAGDVARQRRASATPTTSGSSGKDESDIDDPRLDALDTDGSGEDEVHSRPKPDDGDRAISQVDIAQDLAGIAGGQDAEHARSARS